MKTTVRSLVCEECCRAFVQSDIRLFEEIKELLYVTEQILRIVAEFVAAAAFSVIMLIAMIFPSLIRSKSPGELYYERLEEEKRRRRQIEEEREEALRHAREDEEELDRVSSEVVSEDLGDEGEDLGSSRLDKLQDKWDHLRDDLARGKGDADLQARDLEFAARQAKLEERLERGRRIAGVMVEIDQAERDRERHLADMENAYQNGDREGAERSRQEAELCRWKIDDLHGKLRA